MWLRSVKLSANGSRLEAVAKFGTGYFPLQ